MELNKNDLDRYITSEPNNGFNEWYEKVFDTIPESEISAEEYDRYQDFFDDGMNKLALAGSDGFPTISFAAEVITRRFKILKENPELETWESVQSFSLNL
jgi:hypothetical protein